MNLLQNELRAALPGVAKELKRRLDKAKVLPWARSLKQWPEVKALLESEVELQRLKRGQTEGFLGLLRVHHARAKIGGRMNLGGPVDDTAAEGDEVDLSQFLAAPGKDSPVIDLAAGETTPLKPQLKPSPGPKSKLESKEAGNNNDSGNEGELRSDVLPALQQMPIDLKRTKKTTRSATTVLTRKSKGNGRAAGY